MITAEARRISSAVARLRDAHRHEHRRLAAEESASETGERDHLLLAEHLELVSRRSDQSAAGLSLFAPEILNLLDRRAQTGNEAWQFRVLRQRKLPRGRRRHL